MKLIIKWAPTVARPIADSDVPDYHDEFIAQFAQRVDAGYTEWTIPICQELVFAAIRAAIANERVAYTEGYLIADNEKHMIDKNGSLSSWPRSPTMDMMSNYLSQIIK